MSIKQEVLEYIVAPVVSNAKNIMGCSENWYDPYYAIRETFSKEEVESMSECEVENLVKLAESIGEGLY